MTDRRKLSFSFEEGLHGLGIVGADGDVTDIDITVGHGDVAQVLLRQILTLGSEFRNRGTRGGLGSLTAGVGVNFGIQDEDVDVAAGSQNVVNTTVTNIVSPTVTTEEFGLQFGNTGTLGSDAGFALLISIDQTFAQFGTDLVDELFCEFAGIFVLLVSSQAHAETEFSVVFEEGVRPGRTFAFSVLCPRSGRQVTAVDGGAAGGVRDQSAVAEELGQEFDIRCFTAAGAGTGELEQRAEQLGTLDGTLADLGAVRIRDGHEEVPVGRFGLAERDLRSHGQCALRLGRAGFNAEAAAGAVFYRDLDGELGAREFFVTLGIDGLEGGRGICQQSRVIDLLADGSVRADNCALTALRTGGRIPHRDFQRDVAFFPLGGSGREGTVNGHLGDRKFVTVSEDDGSEDFLHKFRSIVGNRRQTMDRAGDLVRIFDFVQMFEGAINSGEVLLSRSA